MGVGVCVWGGVIVEQPLLNSPQPSGQESMLEPARWDRGGRRGRRGGGEAGIGQGVVVVAEVAREESVCVERGGGVYIVFSFYGLPRLSDLPQCD